MTHRNQSRGLQTTAIHAGEAPDPTTGASAPAIHMSSTFVSEEAAGFSAHDLGPDSPFLYARWANPSVDMLERKLAALEGTEACLCTASGMAAASAIFFTFLSAGDHALISDVSYAGVAELARDTLPRLGIEVTTVDMSDLSAVAAALRPNTRLVHSETPVNPIGRLTDLAALARLTHDAGALLSCDATFASPLGQNATALGVDLILHSLTKYVGGHGDAVGGAVAGRADLVKQMRLEASIHHGGILSPFNAWLIARGAATLPLRMKAHQAGAQAVGRMAGNPAHRHPRDLVLQAIRAEVGPDFPIAVAFDLHGNIGADVIDAATVLAGYHYSPHTDMAATGRRAARMLIGKLRGERGVAMDYARPGIILPSIFSATCLEPLATLMQHARDLELHTPGVLDITIFCGFAYADVPDCGMSVVVVTDGDAALAQRTADRLAGLARDWRSVLFRRELVLDVPTGVSQALEMAKNAARPVCILEHADRLNDSTYTLRELLARGSGAKVFAPFMFDPESAAACVAAGAGRR